MRYRPLFSALCTVDLQRKRHEIAFVYDSPVSQPSASLLRTTFDAGMVIARETNKYPDKSIINRHTKPRKPEYNALPRLVYLCRSSDACIAKTEYVKSVHARLTLHLHYHHTTLRTLSYVQNFRLQARPHEIFSSFTHNQPSTSLTIPHAFHHKWFTYH